MSDPRDAIRVAIREMNQSWLEGRIDDVAAYLTDGVVFVAPGLERRIAGKPACLKSFADYVAQAKTHRFDAREPAIDLMPGGDIAVATYSFEVVYEIGGQTFQESRKEIAVFQRESGEWRMGWRTQLQ
jgi:ketosteroid isomerase-like protein